MSLWVIQWGWNQQHVQKICTSFYNLQICYNFFRTQFQEPSSMRPLQGFLLFACILSILDPQIHIYLSLWQVLAGILKTVWTLSLMLKSVCDYYIEKKHFSIVGRMVKVALEDVKTLEELT